VTAVVALEGRLLDGSVHRCAPVAWGCVRIPASSDTAAKVDDDPTARRRGGRWLPRRTTVRRAGRTGALRVARSGGTRAVAELSPPLHV